MKKEKRGKNVYRKPGSMIIVALLCICLQACAGAPEATPTPPPTYTPYPPYPTYTPFPTAVPTNTPFPPSRILKGIQEVGQLITTREEMAQVGLEVRYSGNIACEYSARHAGVGVIEAGINLEMIGEDDIQCDNLICTDHTITLPAPEISSCRIDYIDQYTQEGGGTATCFANEWMDMKEIARGLLIENFLNEALQNDDILGRAGEQGALVLGNLVRELTGGRVNIEFAESSPMDIPDSCKPGIPEGWGMDDEGKWRKAG